MAARVSAHLNQATQAPVSGAELSQCDIRFKLECQASDILSLEHLLLTIGQGLPGEQRQTGSCFYAVAHALSAIRSNIDELVEDLTKHERESVIAEPEASAGKAVRS